MSRLTKTTKPKRLKPRTEDQTAKIRALLKDSIEHRSRRQFDQALKALDAILRMEPENTDALFLKCQIFFEQRDFSRGIHLLQRCQRSKSSNPQLNYIVAYHYDLLKRYDKAVDLLTAALDRRPEFYIARLLLARIYADFGKVEQGKALVSGIRDQLSIRPTERLTYASVLGKLGLYDQCAQTLRELFGDLENRAESLQQFTYWLPPSYWDQEFQATLEEQLSKRHNSTQDLERLHYSAGRLAKSKGHYEEAFNHFKCANDLAGDPFDIEPLQETSKRLREIFHPGFDFRAYEPYQKQVTPVFIIGMPRSGKTSVEHELARHPIVAAGKELDLTMFIDDELLIRLNGKMPEGFANRVKHLTVNKRKSYARAYLDAVLPSLLRHGQPKIVTNTIPVNYKNIGFIKMVFPNAKFIHVTRHPADTCWYCFEKSFKNEHTYTSNLSVLGKYYRAYSEICGHWATILPDDWLNVSYESLVTDTDATRRRVFEFVGLDHDEIGSFANGTDTELTDEYIGYWKHYEGQLQPLLAELDGLL